MSLSNCVPHLCILAPAEKTVRVSRVGDAGSLCLTRGLATGGREGGRAPSWLVLGGEGGSAQRQKEVVPRSHPRSRPYECLPHLPLPGLRLVQLPLSLPSRSNSKGGEACVEVCMFSCSHFIGGYMEATKGQPRGMKHVGSGSQSPRNCVQFLFFPKPWELPHFLISYIGFSFHNPTHTMSHRCIPRKTDAPFGRWLIHLFPLA